MKLKVNVTQEHIDKGVPEMACSCPVAKAVAELLNDGFASTDGVSLTVEDSQRHTQAFANTLPDEVLCFVSDFDHGKPVKPFSFDIQIDEDWLALLKPGVNYAD